MLSLPKAAVWALLFSIMFIIVWWLSFAAAGLVLGALVPGNGDGLRLVCLLPAGLLCGRLAYLKTGRPLAGFAVGLLPALMYTWPELGHGFRVLGTAWCAMAIVAPGLGSLLGAALARRSTPSPT